MPPRRRERPIPDPTVEREMRELHDRLDAMEIAQRWIVDARDISEAKSENEDENKGEEVVVEDATEKGLFRVVARIGAREKMDIPMYEGNLDVEELLDWIRALYKHFDYEDVEEDRKFKHVVTRLKRHATLWWDDDAVRHARPPPHTPAHRIIQIPPWAELAHSIPCWNLWWKPDPQVLYSPTRLFCT
jgi:hypothetical protein